MNPRAVTQLADMTAETDGAIRYCPVRGRVVLDARATTAVLADLAAWAAEHELHLPPTPTHDQTVIHAAEAVVANDGTPRVVAEAASPACEGCAVALETGRPCICPFPAATLGNDRPPADPAAPRGPPRA